MHAADVVFAFDAVDGAASRAARRRAILRKMVIRLRKQSKMAAMELAAVAGVSYAHKRRRVAYLSAAYAEQGI